MGERVFLAPAGVAIRDHAGRVCVIPARHNAYQDSETGTITIEPTNAVPVLVGSRWEPREHADVPSVEIVGLSALVMTGGGSEVEVAVAPINFGDELVDQHGENVAVLAVGWEDFTRLWTRADIEVSTAALDEAAAKLEAMS